MEMLLNNLSAADCCSGKSEPEKKSRCRKGNLAQAYVPFQKICGYFEPREALKEGTIFPSLTGLYNYNKEW